MRGCLARCGLDEVRYLCEDRSGMFWYNATQRERLRMKHVRNQTSAPKKKSDERYGGGETVAGRFQKMNGTDGGGETWV